MRTGVSSEITCDWSPPLSHQQMLTPVLPCAVLVEGLLRSKLKSELWTNSHHRLLYISQQLNMFTEFTCLLLKILVHNNFSCDFTLVQSTLLSLLNWLQKISYISFRFCKLPPNVSNSVWLGFKYNDKHDMTS